MGNYFNPGNEKFDRMIHSEIYVCVSRPRRFGKSMTANMLAAYYSRGCSSENLFQNFKIAKNTTYHISRNQL